MKNARGIIALKVYGLLLGVTALGLGFAGVAKSHRHPGVITQGQYRALPVGSTKRSDVLLYLGRPAQPAVRASQINLAQATKAQSACLVYRAQQRAALGYRFCFSAASDRMVSKQQVNL